MKYIMHVYTPPNGGTVRLQLDDHWFELPTGEPVEIESDFYANALLEHYGHIYGIVDVPYTKSRTGLVVDIEAAEAAARSYLKRSEEALLIKWVMGQKEERVRANLPVLPPTGRVEEIIRQNNIDLKARFGLVPVGMDADSYVDAEKEELKRQLVAANYELNSTRERQDYLDARLSALEGSTTKKGK